MNDVYKRYEKARNVFYIRKTWIKLNPDLVKKEYTDEGLDIPCDGWVRTKEDAKKAVAYYKAFYNKLEYENKLTVDIIEAFVRTIKKYTNYEYKEITNGLG